MRCGWRRSKVALYSARAAAAGAIRGPACGARDGAGKRFAHVWRRRKCARAPPTGRRRARRGRKSHTFAAPAIISARRAQCPRARPLVGAARARAASACRAQPPRSDSHVPARRRARAARREVPYISPPARGTLAAASPSVRNPPPTRSTADPRSKLQRPAEPCMRAIALELTSGIVRLR